MTIDKERIQRLEEEMPKWQTGMPSVDADGDSNDVLGAVPTKIDIITVPVRVVRNKWHYVESGKLISAFRNNHGTSESTCSPPHLCHPYAEPRGRPECNKGDPGACKPFGHPGLHT